MGRQSRGPSPTLASMLDSEMRSRGHTQAEAAAVLHITQPRLSRWLAGHPPGDDRVPHLAEYLHVAESDVAVLVYEARKAPRPESTADRVVALERRVEDLAVALVDLRRLLEEVADDRKPAAKRQPARRSS